MQKIRTKSRRILPAYQRIEDDLRAKIQAGIWQEGTMLPSRRMLAQEYNVSVPTIERAIADLFGDGLLRADDRRGTFVASCKQSTEPMRPPIFPVSTPTDRLTAQVTVGVIAALQPHERGPGIVDRWKETITNSAERTITRLGATARVFNLLQPDKSFMTTENAVLALVDEGVNAVVVVLAGNPNDKQQAVSKATQNRVPLIFIEAIKSSQPAISVCYDSHDAGYQAAQHLMDRGCSDLLFFSPFTCEWVQDRMAGVQQAVRAAVRAAGLQTCVSEETLSDLELKNRGSLNHQELGYLAARDLLRSGLPAQGFVAANDSIGLGFQQAALEAGFVMGRDYALIAFDDIPEARDNGLTTLHPPLEELGQEAGQLVLRVLAGNTTPIQVCLHSHLVSRSSSRLPQTRSRLKDFGGLTPIAAAGIT